MKKKFDSISHFIQTGGFNYRVFDMGRKITPLSNQQFQDIENQKVVYPFPLQQKAWLGLLFWEEGEQDQAFIWFLQFPLDEFGLLQLAARDAFLIELLEQTGKNIQAKQKGDRVLDGLNESPFAFKPREDRLAMFHALANKTLGLGASRYYDSVRDYLSGDVGFDQWRFLGLQGIADVVARLDNDNNALLLAGAIHEMPDAPLESFAHALEHVRPSGGLFAALLKRFKKALEAGDERMLIALLRALSGADSGAERLRLIHAALDASFSAPGVIELLATISGRCWKDLESPQLLECFIEKLAFQDQTAFNAIVADLMMMPNMREAILKAMRHPGRSENTREKLGVFLQGLKG